LGTWYGITHIPSGFVPPQDKGYLLVNVQLPDAASLERTDNVLKQLEALALGNAEQNRPGIPGIAHVISICGQSIVQNAGGSNFGSMFVILRDFDERKSPALAADAIARNLQTAAFRSIQDAVVGVFGPPAVDGLGNAGGFKVMIEDRKFAGFSTLQEVADGFAAAGNERPELAGMFNAFRSASPQLFAEVDREKCKTLNIPLTDAYQTLQVYMGGLYTNDFNEFGRTWQVNLQADPGFRISAEQILRLQVRDRDGRMIPLSSIAQVREISGPALITRFNGVNAAAVSGGTRPGISSGQMITAVEKTAKEQLPDGMRSAWTELTFLQLRAGNTANVVFTLSVLLVFLLLAAQYESLRLPFAVILVVPMCLLSAVAGVAWARLDLNIFVQIGLVVLVGLASKNAILIVEFAREKRAQGTAARDAAVAACQLRLRPILMTSFAFILGVVPLVLAEGAGAEMRSTLGIAVFAGMLGVTVFGLILTPVFYFVLESVRPGRNPVATSPEDTRTAHENIEPASS
jgi:multidrug efflux pump